MAHPLGGEKTEIDPTAVPFETQENVIALSIRNLFIEAAAAAVLAASSVGPALAQAVDQYGSHFEHPGFKPIGIVH